MIKRSTRHRHMGYTLTEVLPKVVEDLTPKNLNKKVRGIHSLAKKIGDAVLLFFSNGIHENETYANTGPMIRIKFNEMLKQVIFDVIHEELKKGKRTKRTLKDFDREMKGIEAQIKNFDQSNRSPGCRLIKSKDIHKTKDELLKNKAPVKRHKFKGGTEQ